MLDVTIMKCAKRKFIKVGNAYVDFVGGKFEFRRWHLKYAKSLKFDGECWKMWCNIKFISNKWMKFFHKIWIIWCIGKLRIFEDILDFVKDSSLSLLLAIYYISLHIFIKLCFKKTEQKDNLPLITLFGCSKHKKKYNHLYFFDICKTFMRYCELENQ